MAEGAAFVLGHNLIAFDLPHLAAVRPDLRLLQLPAIDTLRLNPLAFPRNPYHHLVKHYRNGPLQGDRVNDPELPRRTRCRRPARRHAARSLSGRLGRRTVILPFDRRPQRTAQDQAPPRAGHLFSRGIQVNNSNTPV
jgi:hypothetical protein